MYLVEVFHVVKKKVSTVVNDLDHSVRLNASKKACVGYLYAFVVLSA